MRKLLAHSVSAVLLGVVVVAILMYVAHGLAVDDWAPFNGKPEKRVDWGNAARIAVPGAALIAALVGAVIAAHGHRTRLDELQASRDANVTDRYTKAIEQLGNTDSIGIRIGGIYALERIAKDSRNDLPTICRVLEEHARATITALEADQAQHESGGPMRVVQAPADLRSCFSTLSRLQESPNGTFDLHDITVQRTSLQDQDLVGADLRGAILRGADLSGADLSGANLTGANLGGARLSGADFSGADLTDADLTDANLTDANLQRANLTDANLQRANLALADLTSTKLARTDVTGAKVTQSQLVVLGGWRGTPEWLDGRRGFNIGRF